MFTYFMVPTVIGMLVGGNGGVYMTPLSTLYGGTKVTHFVVEKSTILMFKHGIDQNDNL